MDRVWVCDTTTDKDNIPSGSYSEGDLVIVKGATPKLFIRGASSWVEHVSGAGGGSVPAGCIVMFHGLLANIPSGFVLCDGANGTPDLRSKFVKGAAAGADPGATGGSATHSHADHASHTHTYTQVPNHVHGFTDLRGATTGGATTTRAVTEGSDTSSTATGLQTGNPVGGVATGTTNGPSATLTHDTVNSEPPYYAVAFIMKA